MEEVKVGNAFTTGDTNYVYLTDKDLPEGAEGTIVGTLLNTTKFNGELGFREEDGEAYPPGDPDAAYVAEYKIGVFMQGSEDLTLAVNFEGLTVTLGEGMTTGVTTERLWSAVFSKLKDAEGKPLFESAGDLAPHVGTAAKDAGGKWVLTDPDGAEGYVFELADDRPAVLKLDRAMTEQLFRISVARVIDGVVGAYGNEVLFTYPHDVKPDLADCTEHELRLKIEFGYADENDEGIPFPFADEAFRGCTFGFEVTARAL